MNLFRTSCFLFLHQAHIYLPTFLRGSKTCPGAGSMCLPGRLCILWLRLVFMKHREKWKWVVGTPRIPSPSLPFPLHVPYQSFVPFVKDCVYWKEPVSAAVPWGPWLLLCPVQLLIKPSGVWELLWPEQGSLGETLLQVSEGRSRRRDGQRESVVLPAVGSCAGELP